MIPVSIQLTKKQADMAAWALDPMTDYAGNKDDGCNYEVSDLPCLDGDMLTFPTIAAVPDMLYRLEKQIPEMADSSFSLMAKEFADIRVASNLAEKIRKATGYDGPVWMGPEDDDDATSTEGEVAPS